MFSKPGSARISELAPAARILGGQDMTDEGRAFMERYGVRGFPMAMALTAGGDLVDPNLLRDRPWTVDGIVRHLESADQANRAFLTERDDLLARGDMESLLELATRYEQRHNASKATDVLAKAAEKEATAEILNRLALAHLRAGNAEEERAVLGRLLESFPEHEDHVQWRIRLATMHLPAHVKPEEMEARAAEYLKALEGLRAELEAADENAPAAEVRMRMVDFHMNRGDADKSRAHVDWIIENAPSSRGARGAHMAKARQALRDHELDVVRKHASKIIELAPESIDAADARILLSDLAYMEGDLAEVLEHLEAIVRDVPDSRQAEAAGRAIPKVRAELKEGSSDD